MADTKDTVTGLTLTIGREYFALTELQKACDALHRQLQDKQGAADALRKSITDNLVRLTDMLEHDPLVRPGLISDTPVPDSQSDPLLKQELLRMFEGRPSGTFRLDFIANDLAVSEEIIRLCVKELQAEGQIVPLSFDAYRLKPRKEAPETPLTPKAKPAVGKATPTTELIYQYISAKKGQPVKARELKNHIDRGPNSFSSALSRLTKQGRIFRVHEGEYSSVSPLKEEIFKTLEDWGRPAQIGTLVSSSGAPWEHVKVCLNQLLKEGRIFESNPPGKYQLKKMPPQPTKDTQNDNN